VLDDLVLHEQEVRSADGKVYAMRVRPYRTTTNVIDGVVMTFNDVTAQKTIETALRESEARGKRLSESS
jgi:two-component system CheB/CheR fusion protein